MDFLERLKSLWPDNAKPADFYNKIDMSASGFSRVWKDGAIPTADYLIKIQEVTGCDLNWLLTGQGSPYMNKRPSGRSPYPYRRYGYRYPRQSHQLRRVRLYPALRRLRRRRARLSRRRRQALILHGIQALLDRKLRYPPARQTVRHRRKGRFDGGRTQPRRQHPSESRRNHPARRTVRYPHR